MFCDLCTMDVIRGDMYTAKSPTNPQQPWHVCESCRNKIIYGTRIPVDEVEEHNKWMESVGIKVDRGDSERLLG